jgi:hypothetical protein
VGLRREPHGQPVSRAFGHQLVGPLGQSTCQRHGRKLLEVQLDLLAHDPNRSISLGIWRCEDAYISVHGSLPSYIRCSAATEGAGGAGLYGSTVVIHRHCEVTLGC